ncbi:nucleotidyl transferase AbiEii/AbiGii toxin family protein [Pedobacter alluvionis]|uniref:Nucleotidyltransferase AbiEii toxin of type IV toxin-antitoxin system n=1 Tax=Pedobacter alluvionis TaxID=475253 RepID=A0A497YBA9_9SPHI|nr:nucleotidyl transferase AbiEii/AbiGii toxin family protein [Pedobacter alluvionis]RLJ79767.1 nucleotidyltransferase AbiEii toxin of type IV toxin-antitoxin system [Pedobacter alluvionis]
MYWNTVNQLLKNTLLELIQAPELAEFRLVGGTALSLYLGHRLSVDIELFTDAKYGLCIKKTSGWHPYQKLLQ